MFKNDNNYKIFGMLTLCNRNLYEDTNTLNGIINKIGDIMKEESVNDIFCYDLQKNNKELISKIKSSIVSLEIDIIELREVLKKLGENEEE